MLDSEKIENVLFGKIIKVYNSLTMSVADLGEDMHKNFGCETPTSVSIGRIYEAKPYINEYKNFRTGETTYEMRIEVYVAYVNYKGQKSTCRWVLTQQRLDYVLKHQD